MFSRIAGRFSLSKLEPGLFTLCIVLTLWPILISKYYVTLDGPSHVYNANLLKQLICGSQDNISDLYRFNRIPVPNCTGHFIIAFFDLFFPAFLSEKLMMILYFVLTPVFFRKCLVYFKPNNLFGTYFIFPLLHNNLFYFGFFNLCLGMTAMLAAFSYFLHAGEQIKVKQYLSLTFLLGIVFFSHFMTFLIVLTLLLAFSFVFLDFRRSANGFRVEASSGFKKRLVWVLICSFPWLILGINYYIKVHATGPTPVISLKDLLLWLVDFRPLLALGYGPPLINFGRILSLLFACLMIFYVFRAFKRRSLFTNKSDNFDNKSAAASIIFLIFWLTLLILFLVVPNFLMVCDRILVLSYIFLFCWLTLINFPKWLGGLSLLIIVYVQTSIISEYYEHGINSDKDVPKIEALANYIPEGSFVLVLNYSGYWLYDHASGYIGANRRLALLENYEAGLPWFPVNWNSSRFMTDTMVHNLFSNKDLSCSFFVNKPDTQFFSFRQKNGKCMPIDYVFQMGNSQDELNTCVSQTRRRLDSSYIVAQENDFCKLYFRKKNSD
jgi:hypothetical protein